jgi:dienelactone hydrolase
MVPNVLNVLDFLYTRPDVDTSRISLAGYSFGAPFVPVLMKLDPRFKCAVIAYGGGNIGGMLSDNLKTGTRVTDWLLGHILGVLLTEIEPTKYVGSIPPRPVLYINGYQDNLIRPERARLLHAKAPEPKDVIWLESRHMDPGKPEVTKLIVETSVQWLQKKGLIN